MKMSRRAAGLLIGVVALAAACHIRGKEQLHNPVGDDAAAIRAAFNADVGKVRVLMLVAPT